MSETLASLEQRLRAVERDLADVRQRLLFLTSEGTAPALATLRQAQANQRDLAVTAQEVFAVLGISTEPVEAEAAQKWMLAEGVRAENNAFSRGIIEMREE
jgi:hypothetical protein